MEFVCDFFFVFSLFKFPLSIKIKFEINSLIIRGIIFYGMIIGKLPFQAVYKPTATHYEKRKFLMEETKRGLTSKHNRYLTISTQCK